MPCAICRRGIRGFYFGPTKFGFCSMEHLDWHYRLYKQDGLQMYDHRDWNSQEQTALFAASDAAGDMLEAVNQTDLAKLDSDQWKQFIATIVKGYCAKLAELETLGVPF